MSDYQGWTNIETWCINLHLSNDRGMYETINMLSDENPDSHAFADAIRDYVEESVGSFDAGMVSDMLAHFQGQVNWREIAISWREP